MPECETTNCKAKPRRKLRGRRLARCGRQTGRRALGWLLLTLVLAGKAVLAQTADATGAQPATGQGTAAGQVMAGEPITILPGDILGVTLFEIPELSRDARVSEDGKVNLPLVGELPVAGLTEVEAAHRVDEAYLLGHFVLHPQASVIVREFASKGVSITGEVVKPNIYPVPGPRSLLDVIALAGGLTQAADTRIAIRRRDGTLDRALVFLPVDNGPLTLEHDTAVAPGDRIVVQRAGMVYVLGEVARPGGYLMQVNGKISVLQALAAAGGFTRIAGENKSVVIERRGGKGYSLQPLRLRDILKGKSGDFALEANDVIYVPSSEAKNFVVNAPQILGTLAGAAIYSLKN